MNKLPSALSSSLKVGDITMRPKPLLISREAEVFKHASPTGFHTNLALFHRTLETIQLYNLFKIGCFKSLSSLISKNM